MIMIVIFCEDDCTHNVLQFCQKIRSIVIMNRPILVLFILLIFCYALKEIVYHRRKIYQQQQPFSSKTFHKKLKCFKLR